MGSDSDKPSDLRTREWCAGQLASGWADLKAARKGFVEAVPGLTRYARFIATSGRAR